MTWILVGLAIALPLVVLAVLLLGLWGKVKVLTRQLARAGELAEQATATLAAVQPAGPRDRVAATPGTAGRGVAGRSSGGPR